MNFHLILYFTGSKYFNVGMRERALNMGYSLNEHGFYKMDGKVKGEKIDKSFSDEESIFRFLNRNIKPQMKDRVLNQLRF